MKATILSLFCCAVISAVYGLVYDTTGGNSGGAVCKFPFVFQGIKYTDCIRKYSNNEPWCAVTSNYDIDKRWGYCVQEKNGCDCDYSNGGCRIVKSAPWNKACQCKYKGAWTCQGYVTTCSKPGSEECRKPSTSFKSCINGGGDCNGYKCDCDYKRGGCKISSVPSPGSACKCIYRGFWTCGGRSVQCKNDNDTYCKSPSGSYDTCKYGGGDCGGY